MGLDTTHDCYHGGYTSFNIWRGYLAEAAGIPLWLMEGYYDAPDIGIERWLKGAVGPLDAVMDGGLTRKVLRHLPLSWALLRPDPLHVLLDHSDCDGEIPAPICGPLADRLTELLPKVSDGEGNWPTERWRDVTRLFAAGLRDAAAKGEAVGFH